MKTGRPPQQGTHPSTREHYHHGALRDALIKAADEILKEKGIEGFSLREAARRAQVSPAAPAHHFGNAAGLLTEVAILGFDQLANDLRKARESDGAPDGQLQAQGLAYVHFALADAGRFHLMFRHDLVESENERLTASAKACMAELEAVVVAYLTMRKKPVTAETVQAQVLGAWSTVHGFSHLALDGKFSTMTNAKSLSTFVSDELTAIFRALWPGR